MTSRFAASNKGGSSRRKSLKGSSGVLSGQMRVRIGRPTVEFITRINWFMDRPTLDGSITCGCTYGGDQDGEDREKTKEDSSADGKARENDLKMQ